MIRFVSSILSLREASRHQIVLFPCHPRTKAHINNHKLGNQIKTETLEPRLFGNTTSYNERSAYTFDQVACKKKPFPGSPVPLRDDTEWPETIKGGEPNRWSRQR